jgi:heme ABC exporter ATP-binding subunit CcmA
VIGLAPTMAPRPETRGPASGARRPVIGFRSEPTGSVAAVAMEPVVRLRSAVCLLGRFPALAGVDLEVAVGEVVQLEGPNGAGKTTLLRALAGLVPVVGGEARVLGHDLRRDRRAVRRGVGLLGHADGLYDELSVAANVRFWGRAAGAVDQGPERALARLGVAPRLLDVPTARLSLGQRRRVALAVLVARRPALWLLDEPHAGLDAEGRELLDDLLGAAVGDGATVVLASHDPDRVSALAGRRVSLAGGRTSPPARRVVGVA